ncbi:LPD7 domain-containing protein [Parasulfitobacter algicola]|uniref:Large polyvalent protein-associated domain-containing protein n=1 Tax=Parasulfitobacter algicola TaxID=2614809 RepID=A0ABX2J0X1_9RHOB|nr:LPD7 domain-containing protein [Sulfitobacter algicola]NSX56803.1 hypothetical protein [Sulfitobacter algicola]
MAQDSDTDQSSPTRPTYQLYDPTMDTTYAFANQQQAINKAKELGSSRFQQVQEDGSFLQINVADAEKDIAGKQTSPEPVVLQEPSERPGERSTEDPPTTSSKTAVQASADKPVAEPSPASVIEPDPALKVPDRDDPFSRPNGFDQRFVVTKRRNAQDLYRSYDDKRPAIEDQGDSLRTKNADRATAMDMIELAAHRGWSKMNVKGPEEFRREMWIEGQAQGIEVRGYRPSDKDRAEAERRGELVGYRVIERTDGPTRAQQQSTQRSDQNETISADKTNVVELPNYDKGVRGTITAIGDAPYKDREGASPTPYIEMNLGDGRSHKIWGVGLHSMVSDNQLSVGDQATIASAGRKPVTVEKYDEKSGEMKKIETFRREWAATNIDRTQAKTTPDQNRTELVTKRDDPQLTAAAKGKDDDVIYRPDRRAAQDRATELEDRMKSTQAARDPDVRGAASKLSLMEAELKAQGIDRADVNIAVSNARTQMSKELASGKKIPVEKLANVSRQQEEKAKVITSAERNRTVERERTDTHERTPGQ